MKGKAVVFEDRLKVRFRELEIPDPEDGDVVIEVEHSWISPGTESSFLRGERIAGEVPYQAGGPWPFPQVAGYQKVGVIRSVGAAVQGLEVGDRVFATVSRIANMFTPFGGHMNPSVTKADQVWKLPSDKPSLAYSGAVLTQVGYNCGSRPPVHPGVKAVVIGDGLVGHWTAQTLAHRGANVLVLGKHDWRLGFLPKEIASCNIQTRLAVNASKEFAPEGVFILVDTVGDMNTVNDIQPFMCRDSHIVSAGFLGNRGTVDIQQLRLKEITLHTPSGWTRARMEQTLQGITAGWLQTAELITHRFPAEQAEQAWSLITEKKEPSLGVVLDW